MTLILFCLLLGPALLSGQQLPVQVHEAQLSIPFDAHDGYLVVAGEQLVFVNVNNPEASFGVAREALKQLNAENEMVGFTVAEPAGNRKKFTFRLKDPAASAALLDWQARERSATGAAGQDQLPGQPWSYRAQHNHFVTGACEGQLIISEDRVSFESLSKVEHSRQWDLADIKEIKRRNPYQIHINPFSGSQYDFKLLNQGMSNREYQRLASRIAEQRAPE